MHVPQPGDLLGRYRLDRVIGRGGMGVVYAATDTRLDRTVAVKVITGALAQDREFLGRFHDEATTLTRLDSPNVIQILDHDEVDGVPFIVTQYVDGTDLAAVLARGPLPLRTALVLCAQVARGLGDAHRRGVVHRDVKPGNVLVRDLGTPDAHAYVCDFGIARSDSSAGRTAVGVLAGTWAYLAPERTQGAPASPASDLYALGCLLWACLTGGPPYEGTDVEMAFAHTRAPVPQLMAPDPLIAEVDAVLARLMAKDPADRYPDAAAARADIERLVPSAPDDTVPRADGSPVGPVPGGPGTTVPRGAAPTASPAGRRRWRVVVAAAIAVAVTGGAGVTALLLSGDEPAGGSRPADAQAVVSGDLDGDGYGDVLLHQDRLDALSPLPTWTLASTGRQFGSPVRGAGEDGFAGLGDVDGDDLPDLVWTSETADDQVAVSVIPADGERWHQTFSTDPALGLSHYTVDVEDVSGDGLADLVIGGRPDDLADGVHVAVSEGDGFAEPEQWWAGDTSDGLQWSGDFDGDGVAEVLYWADTEAATSGEMRVLTAEGGRLVESAVRLLDGHSVNPIIATWLIGDPDGDGAEEIVVPNATGRRIFLYEVADGRISDPRPWAVTRMSDQEARERLYDDGIRSFALSDVDGDGDDDLVELHDPRDQEIGVWVRPADGEAFGEPAPWGSLPCGSECEDSFRVVY